MILPAPSVTVVVSTVLISLLAIRPSEWSPSRSKELPSPFGGRSMVRKLLGPVVLALAFPVVLAAQSQATTGVIRGTVTDPSGTAVAGATVVLHETQTGFQRQVVTNERGIFVAPLMPLGTYDVSARAVGFSEARRTGVRLGLGETVNLNLALAAVRLQAVVVEATEPVVVATKIESSTRLPEAAVARLPKHCPDGLD